MKLHRHGNNPLITVKDIPPSAEGFEVIGVFNAGTALYQGRTVLLLRVAEKMTNTDTDSVYVPSYNENDGQITGLRLHRQDKSYDFSDPRVIRRADGYTYLTSISHLRLAYSDDGLHFTAEEKPFIKAFDRYSAYGVEDARITAVDDGRFYITFSAVSSCGIVTRMISTEDFVHTQDHGNIFHPDNKDVTLFPQKINGLYYALHRPSTSEYGRPNIWLASSPDLLHWGNHRLIAPVREGLFDDGRVGASCVPILTRLGYLEIYHGATLDNRYCLGAMLLDADAPWRVLARAKLPILEPSADYEMNGFFGNVVFSCGAVQHRDALRIYYGASDDCVCLAETSMEAVLDILTEESLA